jgi:hypothetical protein
VPDPIRQPAIRVVRPYASEKEFVEGDFTWLGRPTLVLPNTPARSPGDLVRFELVLSNGSPIFRGEGQVVAYHPPGGGKTPGLEVRITRMDAKSKAMLDQMRQRRTANSRTAPPKAVASSRQVESIAPAPTAVAAAPPPNPMPTPEVARLASAQRPGDQPPVELTSDVSERSGVHLSPARARVAPPPNREEILDRLRERARQLAAKGGLPARKTKQIA